MISLMLLPYIILIRIKTILSPTYYVLKSTDTPFFQWFIGFFDNSLSQALLGVFLVFLQGVSINRLVIKNRISTEQSLVPGLIYVLFASMIPEFLVLSPELISSSFLIASMSNLYLVYGKKANSTHIFNVGVLVSISSLIYYPSIIFLIIGVIGFVMLRSIKLKGLVQLIIGAALPYYLLFSYYFYYGNMSGFKLFYSGHFNWINRFSELLIGPNYSIVLIVLLTVTSIIGYTLNIRAKSIQTQEKIDLLYIYLIVFLISSFVIQGYGYSFLFFHLMPLAIFFTLWLLRIKKKIIPELIHLSLLVLLIYFNYFNN